MAEEDSTHESFREDKDSTQVVQFREDDHSTHRVEFREGEDSAHQLEVGDEFDEVGTNSDVNCDTGEQIATVVEVCGESLVASRHTVYLPSSVGTSDVDSSSSSLATTTSTSDPQVQVASSSLKPFTRGSVVFGSVINHDPALIACLRDLTMNVIPDGDRVVFACEIRGGTEQSYFFVIVTSKRGIAHEESVILVVSSREEETVQGSYKLLLGIPILSTTSIEFRGKGVFGVSLNKTTVATGETLYFETKSLHSMWAAIVSLEKARDQAKANNVFESDMSSKQYWILDYFAVEDQQHQKKFPSRYNSSSETVAGDCTEDVDPEDEGEGGSAIVVGNLGTRSIPAGSFSSFGGGKNPNVGIFESEPGVALRLFSISALKRGFSRRPTTAALKSSTSKSYSKPDLDVVSAVVFDFVSSAQDPDDLSVSDVIDHLKAEFGVQIIGKLGYSSAMIDGIIYRVVGQMEPPSLICDRLFLGSEYNAANKAELKSLGITHILNVTVEVSKFFPQDFQYHQVCVLDTPQATILPYLERALDFMDAGIKSGGCLVHCQRGVSRSASFVIAYLMKTQRLCAEDAIKQVKQRRRIVKPNTGFVKQLKEWEAMLAT